MIDFIFSDIHADISALNLIWNLVNSNNFKKKYGEITRVINLGDVLQRGTHPKEVLCKIREIKESFPLESVMGNHDEAFLYKRVITTMTPNSVKAHQQLSIEDLCLFKKNDDGTYGRQEFIDNKNSLVCVHGGPLDPQKIIPKNSTDYERWLCQKSWQRLTNENFNFFTKAGYHYKPSTAFSELKEKFDNFIILCGHQHREAMFQDDQGIEEIHSKITSVRERISDVLIEKKELVTKPYVNYLIQVGLAGPEGSHEGESQNPHFAIYDKIQKKIILFGIKDYPFLQ